VRPLKWWGLPRKAWIIILAELCAIIGLSGSVVSTYFSDIYFQNYVNGLAPILIPVVSVGFGVASASTATVLYFRMKNLSRPGDATIGEDARPRGQKHAARRVALTDDERNVTANIVQTSRLRPLTPGGNSPSRSSTTSSVEKKESTSP
jgi:hypothetical protein